MDAMTAWVDTQLIGVASVSGHSPAIEQTYLYSFAGIRMLILVAGRPSSPFVTNRLQVTTDRNALNQSFLNTLILGTASNFSAGRSDRRLDALGSIQREIHWSPYQASLCVIEPGKTDLVFV
jgi:hypothetical protein